MLSAGSHVTAGLATTPVVVVVAVVAGVAPIVGAVTVNATEGIAVSSDGVSPPDGILISPVPSIFTSASAFYFKNYALENFIMLW